MVTYYSKNFYSHLKYEYLSGNLFTQNITLLLFLWMKL